MTITLDQIKKEQSKLATLIAKFEAQNKTIYGFPETTIELAAGEHYAGLILGKDGNPSYHLILLPGELESGNWEQAKEFAKSINGELPTRREQSLLFANLKEEFQEAWYWSGEEHASYSGYAWYQNFRNGGQGYWLETSINRARAVRRLIIE